MNEKIKWVDNDDDITGRWLNNKFVKLDKCHATSIDSSRLSEFSACLSTSKVFRSEFVSMNNKSKFEFLIRDCAESLPYLQRLIDKNTNKDIEDNLAIFLGFNNKEELRCWADYNPELWGNDHGLRMFSREKAYGATGRITYAVIINHWNYVSQKVSASYY